MSVENSFVSAADTIERVSDVDDVVVVRWYLYLLANKKHIVLLRRAKSSYWTEIIFFVVF